MITLNFSTSPTQLTSKSQIAKNLTESWVSSNIYCPSCGSTITQYPNNHKSADFYCDSCKEDYELKSKKDKFGSKIVDGEYNTMIQKINSSTPSNFFFLAYKENKVSDFFTIPKFFFTPEIIEKRKPLSEKARRAGWTGCNILYNQLPNSSKIFYIKNSEIQKEDVVLEKYKKISFVAEKPLESKEWLLDVMFCVENLGKEFFVLNDIYKYEDFLKSKHPENSFVKDKIRQQLQFLRNKGFIKFLSKGNYRLIK